MKPDLFWIPGLWRGKLAVSSRPRGGDWLDGEVNDLRASGLDTIVSLLERDEATELGLEDERKVIESNGLEFLSFPIPDRGVPPSMRDTVRFLGKLAGELGAGKSIAVHCRQGVGRSGLLAAGSLIASGVDPREAVQVVSDARGIAIPETSAQLQWLDQLASEYIAAVS